MTFLGLNLAFVGLNARKRHFPLCRPASLALRQV
jgi:hypothetical protein